MDDFPCACADRMRSNVMCALIKCIIKLSIHSDSWHPDICPHCPLPLHLSPSLSLPAPVEVHVALWDLIPILQSYFMDPVWANCRYFIVLYSLAAAVAQILFTTSPSGAPHILSHLCRDLHYDSFVITFFLGLRLLYATAQYNVIALLMLCHDVNEMSYVHSGLLHK